MKLSKETIKILENLCQINDTIIFKEGSRQVVGDAAGKVIADVTLAEHFPKRFSILEVKNLLSAISLFDNPDIEFNDTNLVITEGSNSIGYAYCAEYLLKDYIERNGANLPDPILSFTIDQSVYKKVKTASKIFGSKTFIFKGDGKKVYFCTGSESNGKTIEIAVGDTDRHFNAIVNIDIMNIIADDEYTFYLHYNGRMSVISVETKSYPAKYVVICELESTVD